MRLVSTPAWWCLVICGEAAAAKKYVAVAQNCMMPKTMKSYEWHTKRILIFISVTEKWQNSLSGSLSRLQYAKVCVCVRPSGVLRKS